MSWGKPKAPPRRAAYMCRMDSNVDAEPFVAVLTFDVERIDKLLKRMRVVTHTRSTDIEAIRTVYYDRAVSIHRDPGVPDAVDGWVRNEFADLGPKVSLDDFTVTLEVMPDWVSWTATNAVVEWSTRVLYSVVLERWRKTLE